MEETMEKGKFRQFIKIRGANEHNLNNISVDIPRNELVVLTGLSGSGKWLYLQNLIISIHDKIQHLSRK